MINKSLYSSNSDEWTTPQDLFDKLNEEFHFVLDVAASYDNHKCENYFGINNGFTDALKQEWLSPCFCNPPYSRIDEFIKKGHEQKLKGITTVFLIPSRTDTKYWHNYIWPMCELRFIKGRLKFSNSQNSAPFPSVIVIMRGCEA